jgi:hypothetical protein
MVAAYPGLPRAFLHFLNDPIRQYVRQAHAILMATGMFMIATSAALPLLELTDRGISWIVWSFVVSGYTFAGAFVALFAGFRLQHHPPDANLTQWCQTMAIPFPLNWLNIVLVGVSGATSFFPGLLIMIGAYKASQNSVLYDVR